MAAESERVVFGFGTGEVAPTLAARVDVEKMTAACRTVQNMTLGVFGYAERRSGLQFIAPAKGSEPEIISGSFPAGALQEFDGDFILTFAGDSIETF